MKSYNAILQHLLRKDYWTAYHQALDYDFLKANLPELFKVFKTLNILQQQAEGDVSLLALEAGLFEHYPNLNKADYIQLFSSLTDEPTDGAAVISLLNSIRSHSEAAKLGLLALDVAAGKAPLEALNEAVAGFKGLGGVEVASEENEFVEDDLEKLLEKAYGEGGLNWRLDSLNRSLGPLRTGDMGFLFARPETGKTTFLASEATFMAEQLQGDEAILWFNNEEQGSKVLLRCYEACLGVSLDKVRANIDKARDAYNRKTGRRIKLKDDANLSKRDVERICKRYKPKLIIFDQIDKVKGFAADRDDLVLGSIYQWARELAKTYAPVIGVCQAGGEAEGIKYLNMGHVVNAKTSKQAEADWILGIGLDYSDPTYIRGLSISKNKLLGSKESDPSKRHARWEVILEAEVGRYKDIERG